MSKESEEIRKAVERARAADEARNAARVAKAAQERAERDGDCPVGHGHDAGQDSRGRR